MNENDGISRFEHVEEAAHWVKLDLPLQALTSRAAKIIGDIPSPPPICQK